MVVNGSASFMFQKPDQPKQPDGVVFYLAVDDIDHTIENLRARGADVEGPVDQFYGYRYREGTVTDPSGYKLVFTSPVPESERAGS
jgi:predicted enzyme related to lactoylglutathione lyase